MSGEETEFNRLHVHITLSTRRELTGSKYVVINEDLKIDFSLGNCEGP